MRKGGWFIFNEGVIRAVYASACPPLIRTGSRNVLAEINDGAQGEEAEKRSGECFKGEVPPRRKLHKLGNEVCANVCLAVHLTWEIEGALTRAQVCLYSYYNPFYRPSVKREIDRVFFLPTSMRCGLVSREKVLALLKRSPLCNGKRSFPRTPNWAICNVEKDYRRDREDHISDFVDFVVTRFRNAKTLGRAPPFDDPEARFRL